MSERFTINKGDHVFNAYVPVEGEEACGKNGQIKGNSCCGRTITLGGQELNRGSAIDFLREQVLAYNHEHADAPLPLPEKGFFWGLCGGTDDDEIQTIFNTLYPQPDSPPAGHDDILVLAERQHSEGNYQEAVALYEQIEHKTPYVLCRLAPFYLDGEHFEKNIMKARDYLSQVISNPTAEEAYLAFAHYKMGEIYEKCANEPQDMDCALDHYIQSAQFISFATVEDKQFCEASLLKIQDIYPLHEICKKGLEYQITNPKRALHFLEHAASQEYQPAMYHFGCLCQDGFLAADFEENLHLADQYLRGPFDSIDSNEMIDANARLGRLHKELGNWDNAFTYYARAAVIVDAENSPHAKYLLAQFLETEDTGYTDLTQARQWYTQAADLGHAEAIQALARLDGTRG